MHTIVIRSSSTVLVPLARRVRRGLAAFGCRGRIGRGVCILRSAVLRAGVLCRGELQGVEDEEIVSGVVCGGARFGGSVSGRVVSGVCGCAFLRHLRNVEACLWKLSWRVAVDGCSKKLELWDPNSVAPASSKRLVCAHK